MYVIVGASGFLGTHILQNLALRAREAVVAVGVNIAGYQDGGCIRWVKCDVTDPSAVANLAKTAIAYREDTKVIYLAAYHHPDKVEAQKRLAWDINVTSLARFLNLFWFAKKFVYVSTDSVYGEGSLNRRFSESDPVNPVNRYGVHKAIAETLARGYGFQVVRLPFLIGPSLVPGRKHFYDEIAQALAAGRPFEMFRDAYRSALSFRQAADCIVSLMELPGETPDLLNICGDEALSKYEVGVRIARRLGALESLIVPIELTGGGGIFAVKRASTTLMDNSLMKRTLGVGSVPFEL